MHTNKEDLYPKEFTEMLAKKLHTIWLKNYRKTSNEPRLKTVTDPELQDLDIDRFYGRNVKKSEIVEGAPRGERVNWITRVKLTNGEEKEVGHLKLYNVELGKRIPPDEGTYIAQNIAQEPELINSSLMHKLNGKLAEKYLEYLEPICEKLNPNDYKKKEDHIAATIHDIWIKENKDSAPPKLQVPFSKLSKEEQDKDRRVAKAVFETVQEIKVIEQLKNVEIECLLEDVSSNTESNIKKVSQWITTVDQSYGKLQGTPLVKYCDNTLDNIQKLVPKDIYQKAHEMFLAKEKKEAPKLMEEKPTRGKRKASAVTTAIDEASSDMLSP